MSKNAQAEKLASTLGKGQEESFAQQLAHATGHQGQSQSINPLARNEQVQAQAPLVLQRDMAGEQLAERVQVMLSKNLKNIDIRLDPPELGRLHIRMNMNGDGASVQFTVANPQARDMIEQSMPRLREMLAQQGVQLSDTSVQQQSSGQQQSHYAQGGDGQDAQNSGSAASLSDENIDANVKVDVNVATKRDGISYYA
ncbi:flagellar hook-length control protein FliK [Vibrio olivae]